MNIAFSLEMVLTFKHNNEPFSNVPLVADISRSNLDFENMRGQKISVLMYGSLLKNENHVEL